MLADVNSLTLNPMFLRHDLLIELGRLEIALGSARSGQPANDAGQIAALEQRHATISQTLSRFPV